MDLLEPWTATLKGKKCDACASYDNIVAQNTEPSATCDPAWSQEALRQRLGWAPGVRDALWEPVLALWRLKQVQSEGAGDESWRNLVSAWLVRHRVF
jgi:hypothetical protein